MNDETVNYFITCFNSLYKVLINLEKTSYYIVSKYDIYFDNMITKNWCYDEFKIYLCKKVLLIGLEKNSVICAFILIDRLLNVNKKLLKRENLLNIVIISLIISHKFNEDSIYIDKCYCEVIKKDIIGLCSLEIIFCELINYRLFISTETFGKYIDKVNSNQI